MWEMTSLKIDLQEKGLHKLKGHGSQLALSRRAGFKKFKSPCCMALISL